MLYPVESRRGTTSWPPGARAIWSRLLVYTLRDLVFDHPNISVDGALLKVTLVGARPVHIPCVRTRLKQAFQPEPIGETRLEAAELEGSRRALN